jgi:hypothetical protein
MKTSSIDSLVSIDISNEIQENQNEHVSFDKIIGHIEDILMGTKTFILHVINK